MQIAIRSVLACLLATFACASLAQTPSLRTTIQRQATGHPGQYISPLMRMTGPGAAAQPANPFIDLSGLFGASSSLAMYSQAANSPGGGNLPQGVAVARLLTAGGNLDVVVANFQSGQVGVLLGNGDGTFQPAVPYAAGGTCTTSVAIADVNNDGIPDIVTLNQCGGSGNDGAVGILLGNGDGTFQAATAYDSGGTGGNVGLPGTVVVTDVNRDGIPDIVVSNQGGGSGGDGTVGVLIGTGGGAFVPVAVYDAGGASSGGLAVADLNGDGFPDVVVANSCINGSTCAAQQGNVAVLTNNGDGTFAAAVSYATGAPATAVAIGDLNGDNSPDLFVGLGTYGTALLLNNGNGTFQAAQLLGGAGQVVAVAIGDVNGDGLNDLVTGLGYCATCDGGQDGGIALALGSGGGAFQGWQTSDTGGVLVSGLAFGDLNGDGTADLVAADSCNTFNSNCGGNVAVFLHTPATSLTSALVASANPARPNSTVTLYVSVDNPGNLALGPGTITAYDGATPIGSVSVPAFSGTGNFTLPWNAPATTGTHHLGAVYAANGGPGLAPESSSAFLTEYISTATTTTKLVSSKNPSFIGQQVVLTATVTSGGSPVPDGGAVNFYDGATLLGSNPTVAGTASLSTSSLAARSHTIRATYGPYSGYFASSGLLAQVVNRYGSSVILTPSPLSATVGESVALVATVSTTAPVNATGNVRFQINGAIPGTVVRLTGDQATLTTTRLPAGTPTVIATYLGDTNSAPSSTSAQVTIGATATNTTVSSSTLPDPAVVGQSIRFRAVVKSLTDAVPTGSVTFNDAGTSLAAPVALAGGAAAITVTSLAVGSHAISAVFTPADNGFAGSASPVITQPVQQRRVTVTTSPAVVNGTSANLSGTLTARVDTGQYQYQWSTDPTFASPSVSCTYPGCPTWAGTGVAQALPPFTATNLAGGATYYARLVAYDSSASGNAWYAASVSFVVPLMCAPPTTNCDGVAADGCNVNLYTDPLNCGACGNKCAPAPNGAPVCNGGVCGVGACNAGWGNCDGDPANGCETSLSTDPRNCGACGNSCGNAPNATSACNSGTCGPLSCKAGWGDCNSDMADGCELNLLNNIDNCGACGNVCAAVAHADRACANGACGFACNTGFADCNQDPRDGCETSTGSDPNNCGACGNICASPHATAACTGGTCTMGSCAPGWADCDGNPANGCESNIETDANNCGACGRQCPHDQQGNALSCVSGVCTDTSCVAPHATTQYVNGIGLCVIVSCDPGWSDCNHILADGCELNTSSDNANCGACGNACAAGQSCSNGQCACSCTLPNTLATACGSNSCSVVACSPGWGNCDGIDSNGCETQTTFDPNNCGACGNACGAGLACDNSQCVAAGTLTCNAKPSPAGGGSSPYEGESYCANFGSETDQLYTFNGMLTFTTPVVAGTVIDCAVASNGTVGFSSSATPATTGPVQCTGTIDGAGNVTIQFGGGNAFTGTFSTDGTTVSGSFNFGAFGPGFGVAVGNFSGNVAP